MKRKLRLRNQRWLSEQCRKALLTGIPMKFFVRYPSQQAGIKNGLRLKRRGKLSADWSRATFHYGYVSLPFVSPRGHIDHYHMFRRKSDLPEEYQSRWLTVERENLDKEIQALNEFVERAGLFTDDGHFGSL
ncbi:hypothetical protein VJ309_001376 [Salmonella enterica]|nr:hypothetical protein [Salmonella enterica]EBH8033592.1 hypothetical protein [Salmonella bongori]EBH8949496.1 hypothetical protein [Salmonella enterica subsp. diarizonae serovar 48:i:z]EBQ9603328.1 hypothetical protein [Salmonella enterica subsp. enterica serovar Carmel]ECQ7196946.1 hypothetical protein [Salmonella enterica subsp. diarizonae]